MTRDQQDIVDQAIDWHLRIPTMGTEEWGAFTVWLEADAAHARAFDRIAIGARLLPAAEPRLVAANDSAPSLLHRPWFRVTAGGALAACLVALLAPVAIPSGTNTVTIETAPGETRRVALADGTRIDLNGGSRLHYDAGNLRLVSLDSGEASFHVVHDSSNPFRVQSGGRVIEDVGTVFNVAREGHRLDVQVAEGAVVFQPGAQAVMLPAGRSISVRDGESGGVVAAIPVDSVGGWRSGRLRFTAEPVSRLAEAIHRRYGTDIVLAPAMAKQKFTGILTLSGNAEKDMPHVAALIGAKWRQDGRRWMLSPESREPA